MPISDYVELSLEGMNIDSLDWSGNVLRASFGDGYGAEARNGAANGLHHWVLSASILPDRTTADSLPIGGISRWEYYWSFFKSHTTGTRRVFLITFRGRKYFAEFVDTKMSAEMFTSDLFAGGVEIRQRRVAGYYEGTDGSVFDPSFLASGVWAWHKSETQGDDYSDADAITMDWPNLVTGNPGLTPTTPSSTFEEDELNGRPTVRLNGTTSFWKYASITKTIYEALFLFKCRDAAWANFSGLLTSSNHTDAALVGSNGGTKCVDFSFTGYSYWKDGVLLTASTQNTPHLVYGVIHAKWTAGISLANPQIGWDRDFASRFAKIDLAEIILCDAALSTEQSTDLDGYLNYRRLNP